MKNKKTLFWLCTISTVVAIATHVYLTNHYYNLKYGSAEAASGLCSINETLNCNKTTMSAYSEFLGVPVSIFGGLFNFAFLLLLLCSYFPVISRETQAKLKNVIKLTALSLFVVSVIMGIVSYFVLSTICPACSIAYLMSFVGLVTAWLYFDKGLSLKLFDFKLLAAMGASILVFSFFYHHNSLREFGGKEIQEFAKLQLEEWRNYPAKTIALESPLTMNASSNPKIKLVEFADFLCGHCAQAFPIIHSFAKSHPDVEFSFQAFPLDGECNKAIDRASGVPCFLARISHCAGEQNKAWETQKWIFSNQQHLLTKESIEEKLKANSQDLSLNYENLMTCTDSDNARKAISAQATLGTQIGITGTPSVFINGKKVPAGFTLPLLEKIYQEAN